MRNEKKYSRQRILISNSKKEKIWIEIYVEGKLLEEILQKGKKGITDYLNDIGHKYPNETLDKWIERTESKCNVEIEKIEGPPISIINYKPKEGVNYLKVTKKS